MGGLIGRPDGRHQGRGPPVEQPLFKERYLNTDRLAGFLLPKLQIKNESWMLQNKQNDTKCVQPTCWTLHLFNEWLYLMWCMKCQFHASSHIYVQHVSK